MPTALVIKRWSCAALMFALSAIGCRSAVSTLVTPDPENGGWKTKHLRGVPITVMVPTGLEIRIVEHRFFEVPVGSLPQAVLDAKGCPLITRHVQYDIREKQEVFTVDAVRPAAGTLTYSSTFAGQYFSGFNTKVEDTTIDTITAAVKGITGVLPKKSLTPAKSTSATPEQANMPYTEHVVAVKLFDVNSPCLTKEVQEFVDLYINDCPHPCPCPGSTVCPPLSGGIKPTLKPGNCQFPMVNPVPIPPANGNAPAPTNVANPMPGPVAPNPMPSPLPAPMPVPRTPMP